MVILFYFMPLIYWTHFSHSVFMIYVSTYIRIKIKKKKLLFFQGNQIKERFLTFCKLLEKKMINFIIEKHIKCIK